VNPERIIFVSRGITVLAQYGLSLKHCVSNRTNIWITYRCGCV